MAVAEPAASVTPVVTQADVERRGRAFGLEVLSAYEIPALEIPAPARGGPASSLRSTVCREQGAAELEHAWPTEGVEPLVELRFPNGRPFLSVSRHREQGYRIWAPRHGRHVVSPDGREIRSALPRSAAAAWQRLFFAQTLPLAAALQGLELLHASAVGLGGRAIAFTAAAGTGKSSLAAHLLATGATFLTDDVLALELGADGVLAHPGPARASVFSYELRSMTNEGRARLGRRVAAADKPQFEPSRASSALPLAILYRISRSPRFARLGLHEQVPAEPMAVLASSFLTYLRTRERLLNQLAVCDRLTRSVRVYDLEIPASVSAQATAAFVRAHSEGVLAE